MSAGVCQSKYYELQTQMYGRPLMQMRMDSEHSDDDATRQKVRKELEKARSTFYENASKATPLYRTVHSPTAVKELLNKCRLWSRHFGGYEGKVSTTINPYMQYGLIRLDLNRACLKQKNYVEPMRYLFNDEDDAGCDRGKNCLDIGMLVEEEVIVKPRIEENVNECGCLESVTFMKPAPLPAGAHPRVAKHYKEISKQANYVHRELKKITAGKVPLRVEMQLPENVCSLEELILWQEARK